jgi:hypothetical protein
MTELTQEDLTLLLKNEASKLGPAGDRRVAAVESFRRFHGDTYAVRINTDIACSIVFGQDPVATIDDERLALNQMGVPPALPGRQQQFDISGSRIHGSPMKL